MGSSTCSYFQIPHSVGRTTDNDIRSGSYHFYWVKGRGSIRGRKVNFCLFFVVFSSAGDTILSSANRRSWLGL
jgi:hypothetical protein